MAKLQRASFHMMTRLRRVSLVILISGALGMLLFAYLHFSETNLFPASRKNGPGFLVSAFVGAVIGICLYYANLLLDRWLPWRKLYAARFLVGYISNIIIAVSISFTLCPAFASFFGRRIFWRGFSADDNDMQLKLGILLLVSLFIYKVIYALLYSYQQYAVAQLEHLQRQRKQLELQFEALKSQISPHYLFNSLNTISSLIYKDTPSAEQFIRRLAQTYQYILSTQHKRHVTLKDEVDFVQSYYYLLRIRFQQQLSVEINLPSNIMNSKIPPLTLQILVENAVKHNSISNDKKLFIYITAQDNTYLKVINTKNENHDTITSFRVGLENIRKRYAFFTDKKIDVRDDEKFTVTLPVIPMLERDLEHRHSA